MEYCAFVGAFFRFSRYQIWRNRNGDEFKFKHDIGWIIVDVFFFALLERFKINYLCIYEKSVFFSGGCFFCAAFVQK